MSMPIYFKAESRRNLGFNTSQQKKAIMRDQERILSVPIAKRISKNYLTLRSLMMT